MFTKKYLIITLSLLLASCVSSADLKKGMGTSQKFEGYTYDQVWFETIDALNKTNTSRGANLFGGGRTHIQFANKVEGRIDLIAGRKHWGGRPIAVFVTPPHEADSHSVEIVIPNDTTQKGYNIPPYNWSTQTFSILRSKLFHLYGKK